MLKYYIYFFKKTFKGKKHIFVLIFDVVFCQGKYNTVRRNCEKIEMEVIQLRLWRAETLDGELEEDDVDGRSLSV